MIGTSSYRYVTEVIAEAQDLGYYAMDGLSCQRDRLLEANINPRERFRRQLYATMDATYGLIAQKHIRIDRGIIRFVTALNEHVLNYYGEQYGYLTLDEFLEDQYLELPSTYAYISNYIGYEVTAIGSKNAGYSSIDDYWQNVDIKWEKIGWENL